MESITLEQLIEEGKDIRKTISYINPPSGIIRMYAAYSLADNSKYEIWKNKSIRFLSINFPGDRCINDFEESAKDFVKNHHSPYVFDNMLAILHACLEMPQIVNVAKDSKVVDKSVNVHVNQTQSQQQSQSLDIFIDIIKDELTGKQYKEIKEIVETESNPTQVKTKLVDKIRSFGIDVVSNIISNIITATLCK
jgi:hypothetical protein